MIGAVRRVCTNVKRWRNAAMALRWTAAGMMEAVKGFSTPQGSQAAADTQSCVGCSSGQAYDQTGNLRRIREPHSIINRQRSSRQIQR
jgi:hypothetical protein